MASVSEEPECAGINCETDLSNASHQPSPLEQEPPQTKYFFEAVGNTNSSDQIPENMSHDSKDPVHNEQSSVDKYNNGRHHYSEDMSQRYDHHTSRHVQPKCDHVPQNNQRNSEEDMRTESERIVSVTDTATSHIYTPETQLPEENIILQSNQQSTSQEGAENELFPADNRQEMLTNSSCESASSIPSQQAVVDQHDEGGREQAEELDNADRPNISITHMEQEDIHQDIDFRPHVILIESNDRRFDIQLGDELQDEDVVQLGNEMQDENPPWPIPTDIDIHRTGEFDFHQQRQERDIDIQSERRRRAEESE
ncbi:hypothetical protein BsWGS_12340 [Bradybaena similaris]